MRVVLAMLLAAVLASAAPGPAASRVPAKGRHEWKDAIELARGHYVVKTDTYPEVARSLAAKLAEAYVFFEDRFGPLERKARRPMRIELFRNRQAYMEHGGGVRGASGHFDARRDSCALVWRRRPGGHWPVAVHEATHHYFRRRFPLVQPPSWYSEGIACWFEGLLDETTKKHVSRLRIRSAKRAFAAGKADLEDVLRARAQVRDGKLLMDEFRPSRFYGLAWSLCHFLATDDRYSEAFRRFELRMFTLRTLPSVRALKVRNLLEEECGDLKKLELAWHEQLKALPQPAPHRVPPVYGWELSSSSPFVRWSALRRLAESSDRSGAEDGDVAAFAAEVCRRALEDPDVLVRIEAGHTLASRPRFARGAAGVRALLAVLDLGDAEAKRGALDALARKDARVAVPRLLRETEERSLAVRALAAIGDRRSFPMLRVALSDPDLSASVRARCAAALAADPRARQHLAAAARDPDHAVRVAAKTSLGRLDDRAARPDPKTGATDRAAAMMRVLKSGSSTVPERMLACAVLRAVRSKAAIGLLRRHCRTSFDDRVRNAALRALVAITGETRGYEPAQSARDREAVLRRWSDR